MLFTEPSTVTSAVSSYTNSQSVTVSGGVGFGTDRFNIEASSSVTVGTETVVARDVGRTPLYYTFMKTSFIVLGSISELDKIE
jgi:hypothetical protein